MVSSNAHARTIPEAQARSAFDRLALKRLTSRFIAGSGSTFELRDFEALRVILV